MVLSDQLELSNVFIRPIRDQMGGNLTNENQDLTFHFMTFYILLYPFIAWEWGGGGEQFHNSCHFLWLFNFEIYAVRDRKI